MVPSAPTALRRRAALGMIGLGRETHEQRPLAEDAVRRDSRWCLVGHRRLPSGLPRLASWSSPYLLMDVREMLAEAGML